MDCVFPYFLGGFFFARKRVLLFHVLVTFLSALPFSNFLLGTVFFSPEPSSSLDFPFPFRE